MNGFAYKCVASKEDVLKERKSYCPKILQAGAVKGLIIIIAVISIAPYPTNKREHTALYKNNNKC